MTHTKSFGQFLHERGLIDGVQLLDLLRRQKDEAGTVGDVAVTTGLLDADSVRAIRSEQLRNDLDFGSAAVSLGLLSEEQLDDLRDRVGDSRAIMTKLLVDSGYVSQDELARAELEYTERSMVQTLQLRLRLEQSKDPHVAEVTASVLQDLYGRVMGSPLDIRISGTDLPDTGGERVWSQVVHISDRSVTLAMQMTEQSALAIAEVVLGIDLDEFDDLAEDAVCEFLNIVMGHICGNLTRGDTIRAEPPKVTPAEEFVLGVSESVVLECDGDDVVFHFALP